MKQWKRAFATAVILILAAAAAACVKGDTNGESGTDWYKNKPDREDILTLDQLIAMPATEVTDLYGKLIKVSMTVTYVTPSAVDGPTPRYPYPILAYGEYNNSFVTRSFTARFIDMNYWEMDKKAGDTVTVLGYVYYAHLYSDGFEVILSPARLV